MNKKSTKKSRLTVNEKNTEKSTLTHLAEAYARTTDEAGKKEIAGEAVTACDGLVNWVIRRYFPSYARDHAEDMLQEGRIGILEALKGYKPDKARFETYAAYFVKGQIYIYTAIWTGVSRYKLKQLSLLAGVLEKFLMNGRENPKVSEVAAEMNILPPEAKELMRLQRRLENAGEESLAGLSAPDRDEPERAAEAAELNETLWTAVGELPDLQQKIIDHCYFADWIKGRKPSDASVGDKIGLLENKVCKEHKSALRTLGGNQKLRDIYLGEEPRPDWFVEIEPRSRTNAAQAPAEAEEIKFEF
jgi:RNA polymerase sigma factor (sigma-70 family)